MRVLFVFTYIFSIKCLLKRHPDRKNILCHINGLFFSALRYSFSQSNIFGYFHSNPAHYKTKLSSRKKKTSQAKNFHKNNQKKIPTIATNKCTDNNLLYGQHLTYAQTYIFIFLRLTNFFVSVFIQAYFFLPVNVILLFNL